MLSVHIISKGRISTGDIWPTFSHEDLAAGLCITLSPYEVTTGHSCWLLRRQTHGKMMEIIFFSLSQ